MKTTMVVRLHPGQERKLSGAEDKDEDAEEEGEKEDDIIDDGKELEIEIARSEEEEEVGLAEEAEIENVSDDETVGIETMGDSQSVAGIEDDPEEDSLEENPETEGILEDTDGGLEDTAEKAEDGKEELIESESDEESREDLTGECFYFLGLFVCLLASLFGSLKMEKICQGLLADLFTCIHLATPTLPQSVTQVCTKTNRSYYGDGFSYACPLSVPLTF